LFLFTSDVSPWLNLNVTGLNITALPSWASINHSVLQGSGLVKSEFNLVTLDNLNYLLKHADNVTSFDSENAMLLLEAEIGNIMDWTRNNRMTANMIKTKELIFDRLIVISQFFLPS
jgi:hypothetical protein